MTNKTTHTGLLAKICYHFCCHSKIALKCLKSLNVPYFLGKQRVHVKYIVVVYIGFLDFSERKQGFNLDFGVATKVVTNRREVVVGY